MLDAQRVELALDQRGRLVLLEAELGPAVYRAPQLDDPRDQGFVYFDGHCRRSYGPVLYAPAGEAEPVPQ